MKIIDSHNHVYEAFRTGHVLYQTASEFGFDKINVLGLSPLEGLSQNIECAYCKKQWPDRTYAFGGLEYQSGRSFLEQAKLIVEMGFDGFKMIEGKPTFRKKIDLPLDSPLYDEFYAYVEEQELPLLMHVADPADFWDWDKIPQWAKDAKWFYDETTVPFQTLQNEVEHLLKKHPRLKLILAHFFFLSDDIAHARRFLDEHPNVCFDLTSGVEMYYNFSKDPALWRAFFHQYADRLVFGTDSTDSDQEKLVLQKNEINAMQLHFLKENNGRAMHDQIVTGIGLGEDDLEKILHGNFERLAGINPKPINIKAVQEEIDVLLATAEKAGEALDVEHLTVFKEAFR